MKRLGLGLLQGLLVSGTCLSLWGCQGRAKAPARGPAVVASSDKSQRSSVSVTVYNQDFGVVRETRRLRLTPGLVELSYQDVAAFIQPETVRLHSLPPGASFQVLEQNYRYDLLTPQKLLEKSVGKRIAVYRYDEKTGREEQKQAEVLSVEGGVTLRIDGEVTSNFDGRYAFPDVPANLLEKPTLVWLLDSDRAEHDVEVTYLTKRLDWHADYVVKLDASDRKADFNGWVTLDNRSGTSFENAALRLVAGDVNRVPQPAERSTSRSRDLEASDDEPQFREEGLFEYHLYSLERPTNLLDKETKQVSLLSAEGVTVRKKLVLMGQPEYFRGSYGRLQSNQKLSVYVELVNSAQNRLGMPLPKGTVRVYKADQSGALQFIGEDAIDHTPRDEKVSFKLGEAFDVVGERVQKEWVALGNCSAESAYDIEVRNHKDVSEQVEISEPAGGEWQVLSSNFPFVKVDAGTFRFDVTVPARQNVKVSYRIRVRYC